MAGGREVKGEKKKVKGTGCRVQGKTKRLGVEDKGTVRGMGYEVWGKTLKAGCWIKERFAV